MYFFTLLPHSRFGLSCFPAAAQPSRAAIKSGLENVSSFPSAITFFQSYTASSSDYMFPCCYNLLPEVPHPAWTIKFPCFCNLLPELHISFRLHVSCFPAAAQPSRAATKSCVDYHLLPELSNPVWTIMFPCCWNLHSELPHPGWTIMFPCCCNLLHGYQIRFGLSSFPSAITFFQSYHIRLGLSCFPSRATTSGLDYHLSLLL